MYIKKFVFGTKAETLHRLNSKLTKSRIPNFISFSVSEWLLHSESITQKIQCEFNKKLVIVRSSSIAEDSEQSAQAGAYLSLPNVDPSCSDDLVSAVESVIASYHKTGKRDGENIGNQVLIQEMVDNVAMSGVVFTQDLNTGAPYYVINYDDETGSTDSITSGLYNNRTLYVFRGKHHSLSSKRFVNLLSAIEEIEQLVGDDCLDIEFALNESLEILLFQVRRITTQLNWNRGLSLRVSDAITRDQEHLSTRYGYSYDEKLQFDDSPILGNMPDWNPAEMIGSAPRPLAYSLYRYLITDKAWRVARRYMNYKERVGRPLMISLSGQPFIDVRESLYSFLPESLPLEIGDKLVSAWLKRLRDNHHLHDKIEFEIAITCWSFDFESRVNKLIPGVLTDIELAIFKKALLELTIGHISGEIACVEEQYEKIELLATRRKKIELDSADLLTASHLLEDAIELGTVPFSILARHGFIASSLMSSLVEVGALTRDELELLKRSMPTIASEFLQDMEEHGNGRMSKDDYLFKYGHLRPGTYDILSLRYDQQPLSIDGNSLLSIKNCQEKEKAFSLNQNARTKIEKLLKSHKIDCNVEQLFNYIRLATQGREYGKFVFTANLSDALEVIAAWGARFGLSRDELSFLDVRQLLDCLTESKGRSIESHFRKLSEVAARNYQVTTAVRLPFLITKLSDLVIIPLAVDQPNFITRRSRSGEVIFISGGEKEPRIIDGKIVVIESADPGFDWIFSRPILGLVTKFGGANSHMAIRCAEFDLPAAIGCGEQIFERVVKSKIIELLCAEGQVKFIQE